MSGRSTRTWITILAGSALALLLQGTASACLAPASAEVACAPDLKHWEATVTITNESSVDYRLTAAALDTSLWAPEARLTGFAGGTLAVPGDTIVGRATGIPLSTAGATITYTGRYDNGQVETNSFTLGRPVASCDETTTTTGATTTTVVPSTTTVVSTTTTVAGTTTTALAPTTTPTISGKVFGPTTTVPTDVLGETEENTTTTAQPILARTGAGATGHLVLGAAALVLAGIGLVTATVARRPQDATS
jgi:hypothetical protein